MSLIPLLAALMTIILGWERFYNDFLSQSITLPVYVHLIIFFVVVVALAIRFWPATKDRSKELQIIKGESFGTQRIFVEGKHFVNCTFTRTELVYRGEASSRFEHCGFERHQFVFEGPAATTLQTLTNMYTQPIFRPFLDYVFECIKKGKLPKATPPLSAADV